MHCSSGLSSFTLLRGQVKLITYTRASKAEANLFKVHGTRKDTDLAPVPKRGYSPTSSKVKDVDDGRCSDKGSFWPIDQPCRGPTS